MTRVTRAARAALSILVPGLLTLVADPASAWVLALNPGPKQLFLMVGVGTPGANDSTLNTVSVTVPAANIGDGVPLAMVSDSTQSASAYDGYPVCNPPAEVYVGGSYRQPNSYSGSSAAMLQVSTPANLTSGADSIPFSQISWTSTANGDPTADIHPGKFNGGTVYLASFSPNTYVENCFIYSYANTVVAAAGTFRGRATFTLSVP